MTKAVKTLAADGFVSMPVLGEEVAYIRYNLATKAFEEGRGIIKGIGFGPDKRQIVLLRDLELREPQTGKFATFNTPLACVNPTDDFKERYKQLMADVTQAEDEANATLLAITQKANADIAALNDAVLGEPTPIADQ